MEFRYRAGDQHHHHHDPSNINSYFSSQAMQAGFNIGNNDASLPQSMRDLHKHRIREELLSRELIAEKRILEDEVRREIEIERRMAMQRRMHEDRLLLLAHNHHHHPHQPPPFQMPLPGPRVGFVPRYPEIREDERMMIVPVRHNAVGDGNLRMLPLGPMQHPMPLPSPPPPTHFRVMPLNPPLNPNLSGVKRKAADELPRPVRKDWFCSLCKVTTTSEGTLKEHFGGKKHKANKEEHLKGKKHGAKEASISENKATSKITSATSKVVERKRDIPHPQEKGTSTSKPVKNIDLWCDLCGLQCNSKVMLDSHLGGKRHKAQLESKNSEKAGTVATSAEPGK